MSHLSTEITPDQIRRYESELSERKDASVLERAVKKNGILATAQDDIANVNMTPIFSIDLDTGHVANQKQSGRCWMFAALNTMRHAMKDTFNLPGDFELSQNYTYFWDKFEKANYFYENVINTADKPLDDRKVAFLMETPQQDGGQWDMICAIIEKYGVVPQSAMPETFNSSASGQINSLLNLKLRKDAVEFRELVANKASRAEIDEMKDRKLQEVYRILSYSFGEPVTKFDFE